MKSMRLGDRELLVVHKSVVNLHSLAYVVESGISHHVHVDLLNIEDFDSYCHHYYFNDEYVLMYLGDLDGCELDTALWNTRDAGVYYVNVLVAPHHGNARTSRVNAVSHLHITYIPRCDEHVNSSWKKNLNMAWLIGAIPVISNHNGLLRVWVH
ncbi:hypothetical protein [Vulcanisaeta sp. JCM 14467]|uniref:hypothetical protein n=1 Tax=Vulcanisaeta sp. JCM 14467 TaxID=1295370 RepID=UPI000ADA1CCC|nr:hypothetical protein [Vulcanisaeta sp. JCM 14467]